MNKARRYTVERCDDCGSLTDGPDHTWDVRDRTRNAIVFNADRRADARREADARNAEHEQGDTTMIKHADSHLDHNLTPAQVDYLMQRFADRNVFFVETVELPPELGTVPCGLHGPLTGDQPIEDGDVTYARRPPRDWPSRLIDRAPKQVRTVTVAAGPHDGHGCVVFTMYGGPEAPLEPHDPRCGDAAASSRFWGVHALSHPSPQGAKP